MQKRANSVLEPSLRCKRVRIEQKRAGAFGLRTVDRFLDGCLGRLLLAAVANLPDLAPNEVENCHDDDREDAPEDHVENRFQRPQEFQKAGVGLGHGPFGLGREGELEVFLFQQPAMRFVHLVGECGRRKRHSANENRNNPQPVPHSLADAAPRTIQS